MAPSLQFIHSLFENRRKNNRNTFPAWFRETPISCVGRPTNCYKSKCEQIKTVRGGENVIIFIIARQGGKTGGHLARFPCLWPLFLTLRSYDISVHEYGMYRDTCSLPYEFEIATFLMSLCPGIWSLRFLFFIYGDSNILCVVFISEMS